jgi:formylglycine-generating enzyme required for sulfatase activity/tRNA A-37 threonylcarbamoyl transferase component Bud32
MGDSVIADAVPPRAERADALMDPLVGTQLGNYEVVFVLGRGAYGTVYKARDVKLGRYVAIKFLHDFLDARHERMFLREAKAIAALGKHPSIVQIFEWNEYQGRNYFVLEFVGSNASMLLRVNPKGLPVEQAVRVALDAAEGLAYAHKQNIIHRDVKPANILLEIEGGHAKLADFGMARLFDQALGQSADLSGGTPGFMAPEVIRGEEGDVRSDVYSLGATLYQLLSGQLPVEGARRLELLENARQNMVVPLAQRQPTLPPALLKFVEGAMAHDPARRTASAEKAAEELRGLLDALHARTYSVSHGGAAGAVDTHSAEDAQTARTTAFKAAEDARRVSADKLAYPIMTTGIESFRDGEAYERLKQYGQAVQAYSIARDNFLEAEQRSSQVLAEARRVKKAQVHMEELKREADNVEAGRLAPDAYAHATKQEHIARTTPGLSEATKHYEMASKLYEAAAKDARNSREGALVERRRSVAELRAQAEQAGAARYALKFWVAGEKAVADANAALPDIDTAIRLLETASVRYGEALHAASEQVRMKSEQAPHAPIVAAGIDLVWIAPGTFSMGASGNPEEEPVHEVVIANGFWIGRYPVTQAQWTAVMGKNPSGFTGDDHLPVENVSWDDAQEFLQRLSAQDGGVFRLPTEAEWDYACRAGSATLYPYGDDPTQLDDHAWHPDNASSRTHPVGEKAPNAWGLHDMLGNVCEWCEDHWHPDYAGAPTDGAAWLDPKGQERVTRGGSWCIITPDCTSAYRGWYATPDTRSDFMGLRVCRGK